MRKHIGPIATPDVLHVTPDLPKTRSGKIMRRILRKVRLPLRMMMMVLGGGGGGELPSAPPAPTSHAQVAAGDKDKATFGDTSTLADPSVVDALSKCRSPTSAAPVWAHVLWQRHCGP